MRKVNEAPPRNENAMHESPLRRNTTQTRALAARKLPITLAAVLLLAALALSSCGDPVGDLTITSSVVKKSFDIPADKQGVVIPSTPIVFTVFSWNYSSTPLYDEDNSDVFWKKGSYFFVDGIDVLITVMAVGFDQNELSGSKVFINGVDMNTSLDQQNVFTVPTNSEGKIFFEVVPPQFQNVVDGTIYTYTVIATVGNATPAESTVEYSFAAVK